MVNRLEFFEGHRLLYESDNGHMICTCKMLNYVSKEEENIDFIHDTGAIITTLSREQFELLDFDKINVNSHECAWSVQSIYRDQYIKHFPETA